MESLSKTLERKKHTVLISSLSCMKKHWNVSLHLTLTIYYLQIPQEFLCMTEKGWVSIRDGNFKGSYSDADDLVAFLKPSTDLTQILGKKSTC